MRKPVPPTKPSKPNLKVFSDFSIDIPKSGDDLMQSLEITIRESMRDVSKPMYPESKNGEGIRIPIATKNKNCNWENFKYSLALVIYSIKLFFYNRNIHKYNNIQIKNKKIFQELERIKDEETNNSD